MRYTNLDLALKTRPYVPLLMKPRMAYLSVTFVRSVFFSTRFEVVSPLSFLARYAAMGEAGRGVVGGISRLEVAVFADSMEFTKRQQGNVWIIAGS
jgi:hypothetical protein